MSQETIHIDHAVFGFPELEIPDSLREYADMRREENRSFIRTMEAYEESLKEIKHALG